MNIEKIEAIHLRAQIPEHLQHSNDSGRVRAVETVLVRITADGLVGYGEAKSEGGVTAAIAAMIRDIIAPRLIGRDAHAISAIWESLYSGSREAHARQKGHSFPVAMMRRGLAMTAIAGIDMALWDLKGKALGVPVWQLLGGKLRDRLPAYGSGGWADENGIGDQLLGYRERYGFNTVKMRIGVGDGPITVSARRVEAARRALGAEVGIAVDAHGGLTVAEARRFASLTRDLDLAWFEEPVSPDDIRGCSEVRASAEMPIASGERSVTRYDMRDLLDARAVDIIQPDLAICGGLTEAMHIASLASAHNVQVAPHVWGGGVLYAASHAFAAAAPGVCIFEHCMGANPLLTDMLTEPFEVSDGFIAVRDGPGFGIELDSGFIEAHRVDAT